MGDHIYEICADTGCMQVIRQIVAKSENEARRNFIEGKYSNDKRVHINSFMKKFDYKLREHLCFYLNVNDKLEYGDWNQFVKNAKILSCKVNDEEHMNMCNYYYFGRLEVEVETRFDLEEYGFSQFNS